MLRRLSGRILGLFAAGAFLAAPATAQNPYAQPNNSWITVDGVVEAVMPDAFILNYGEGLITVEMDDADRDADAYKLVAGDRVSVTGTVDADLFEQTTIEAGSVFVESLGTTFYASAVDEEDIWINTVVPVEVSRLTLYGTVTSVSDQEFTIDTGLTEITVDVDEMSYNPLDDVGYQIIREGDYVSVTGEIDHDFLEGRELVAEMVTTIVS